MEAATDAHDPQPPAQTATWQQPTKTVAFLDTGGIADDAALVMLRVIIPERLVYVTGAMFWHVSEADKINFTSIRNDIAKLYLRYKWNLFGVETNNYGRSEIESLRREYGLKVIQVNTTGRLTDPKKIRRGESMDKESIVRYYNGLVYNQRSDPDNALRLGHLIWVRRTTPDLRKLHSQVDSFIARYPEGTTVRQIRPSYGAEGSSHDDGVMGMLGALHLVRTRFFRSGAGGGAIGTVPDATGQNRYGPSMGDTPRKNRHVVLRGRGAVGAIKHDAVEDTMLDNYGL